MSLLDKQEVQDICEHTALHAIKWNGFMYKRASGGTIGLLKKEERRMPNSVFYFARCVRKLRYYSDVIHSCHWKSAIEHDGGFLNA